MMEMHERLRLAREQAGFETASEAAASLGIKYATYAGHENGSSGFRADKGEIYARRFKCSFEWLMRGKGEMSVAEFSPTVTEVPRISWVSAGQLSDQDQVTSFDDYPVESAIDLPEGEWICLQVEGNSMNKISPPESKIFVNVRDKRLVTNGCYVICDETGAATYKRYRPNEKPQFQPASYEDVDAPALKGAVRVIGRVRRSVIEM